MGDTHSLARMIDDSQSPVQEQCSYKDCSHKYLRARGLIGTGNTVATSPATSVATETSACTATARRPSTGVALGATAGGCSAVGAGAADRGIRPAVNDQQGDPAGP